VSREGPPWTPEQAESRLRALELFGMRFGLDRMRRMMTALGSPQARLRSIHVVGTNGKSSTTRMIAAILERHGLRTGAYLSPHLISYAERVRIGGAEISPQELAEAIGRAATAADQVNRTLAGDDHVTQFELLTAAALWILAGREVDVAVVEAGLGGRYDATAVIGASVCALTNVGLEHTRWLGPTVRDIAAEKLAVVGDGATLAIGSDPHPDVLELAHEVARERGARVVLAPPGVPAGEELRAPGAFQQRNFALAAAGAQAHLERVGVKLRERAVREAAAATTVPGRLQVLAGEPLTVLDGAHNPDAVAALVESLPPLVGARALGLVVGVLEDKSAVEMLRQLLPLCARAWFTAPPNPRALPPATLESLAHQLGDVEVECEVRPAPAMHAARAWALEQPGRRAVLATGSIYLVGELMRVLDVRAELRPAGEAATVEAR